MNLTEKISAAMLEFRREMAVRDPRAEIGYEEWLKARGWFLIGRGIAL